MNNDFRESFQEESLLLEDGSRVAVIGGGPSGAFFSRFLLDFCQRMDMELEVDLFDSRDFNKTAPAGCNMCGGIVSESLVQTLASESITLPDSVTQCGINSYRLHMDVGSVTLKAPGLEKRIGAVFRGSGPRGAQAGQYRSFDGFLQKLATDKGAKLRSDRITDARFENGKPVLITSEGSADTYDLVVLASGINSSALKLFETLLPEYSPPKMTKTYICEYYWGREAVEELGNTMHLFLLKIPRLEFAALVPKGEYVSLCLLGEAIDKELINNFLESPEVKRLFPENFPISKPDCSCMPRISLSGARVPFADRFVAIGDAGISRLYKDGIGAAYRTAKSAAITAVFHGISARAFQTHYGKVCRTIRQDNALGKLIFWITSQIQARRFLRRAVLNMVMYEQRQDSSTGMMTQVLWDTFTGSAPYRVIILRALHPLFWGNLIRFLIRSILFPNK